MFPTWSVESGESVGFERLKVAQKVASWPRLRVAEKPKKTWQSWQPARSTLYMHASNNHTHETGGAWVPMNDGDWRG